MPFVVEIDALGKVSGSELLGVDHSPRPLPPDTVHIRPRRTLVHVRSRRDRNLHPLPPDHSPAGVDKFKGGHSSVLSTDSNKEPPPSFIDNYWVSYISAGPDFQNLPVAATGLEPVT